MRSLVTLRAARRGALVAFAKALDEADRSAHEIKLGAQLVFEEAFVAEVQWSFLVGEEEKGRRGDFRLRDVVNPHGARFRRGAALQVDFILEPIVEDRRCDSGGARLPGLIGARKPVIS